MLTCVGGELAEIASFPFQLPPSYAELEVEAPYPSPRQIAVSRIAPLGEGGGEILFPKGHFFGGRGGGLRSRSNLLTQKNIN